MLILRSGRDIRGGWEGDEQLSSPWDRRPLSETVGLNKGKASFSARINASPLTLIPGIEENNI